MGQGSQSAYVSEEPSTELYYQGGVLGSSYRWKNIRPGEVFEVVIKP